MKCFNWVLFLCIVFCIIFWVCVYKCFAEDTIRVQVRFTEKTECGDYSDALYYPIDKWPVKQDNIDIAKSERVNNWLNIIKNPSPVVEPTKADLIKEQASIDEQIASLQARKLELIKRINEKDIIND